MSNIGWLAGLLETRGCFAANSGRTRKIPSIEFCSENEELVQRTAAVFDSNVGTMKPGEGWGTKPVYRSTVYGDKALRLMKLIRPHMGARRRAVIDKILAGS